jgi:uncharacterized protein (DUF1501 family)
MQPTRRHIVRLGLSALATALVAPASASGRSTAIATPAKACILLYMHGGPSQIDTFDPKPGRPTSGTIGSVRTRLPGVRFGEHLPRLARRARRLAVVRSLSYREGSHARARYLMHTGYVPQGSVGHPAFGAQVAAARADEDDLPRYVAIGGPGQPAGFLGSAFTPFVVGDPRRPVRNIAPPRDVTDARLDRRLELWRELQADFGRDRSSAVVRGHEAVVDQAVRMMRARDLEAFDIEREPFTVRERYGDTRFGQGCLMARRLCERGVPFVQVNQPGWDTHADNDERTRALCEELDPAFSALLDDLAASGRLDETLVVWLGDFGRTPTMNARGGRDHYPRVANVVLAGGGIPAGQVIGATDDDGHEVVDRPIGVPDLFRTLALRLGLDPDAVRLAPEGRPIAAVDGGTAIDELV